jgi:pimeloyl-ACP methyl ester carboxylesterase
MWELADDPAAMKAFMSDRTSAGNWTSMRFFSSFMSYKPVVPPEEVTTCPILLTQPEKDLWAPLHLAELFLKKVEKVNIKIAILENAGHYPLEQTSLSQMHEAIISFLRKIEASLLIRSSFLLLFF